MAAQSNIVQDLFRDRAFGCRSLGSAEGYASEVGELVRSFKTSVRLLEVVARHGRFQIKDLEAARKTFSCFCPPWPPNYLAPLKRLTTDGGSKLTSTNKLLILEVVSV